MQTFDEPKSSAPSPDWMAKGEQLPWSWAQERLEKEFNFWLVTVRRNGFPQARPVWGLWWADHGLFLSVGHGGLQRASSNQISVHLDNAVEAVVLEGIYDRIVEYKSPQGAKKPTFEVSSEIRREATERYNTKYKWDFDVEGDGLNFLMRPKVAYGWSYKEGWLADSHGTKWTF